jgi:hypothetical protein
MAEQWTSAHTGISKLGKILYVGYNLGYDNDESAYIAK